MILMVALVRDRLRSRLLPQQRACCPVEADEVKCVQGRWGASA